jgi:thiol-disulfide isomerase/thioredoxin
MIKILITAFLLLFFTSGCRTSKQAREAMAIKTEHVVQQPVADSHIADYTNQASWLLGYFNPKRLYQEPYAGWYTRGFDEYKYDPEVVIMLKEVISQDVTITIVMGTWCPDSRREVPRFMRILEAIDFPAERVKFIGVDNVKNSPVENYSSLNIMRVPTFIVYKNNIEKGRIIENPTTSLEQDMVNILTRNEK